MPQDFWRPLNLQKTTATLRIWSVNEQSSAVDLLCRCTFVEWTDRPKPNIFFQSMHYFAVNLRGLKCFPFWSRFFRMNLIFEKTCYLSPIWINLLLFNNPVPWSLFWSKHAVLYCWLKYKIFWFAFWKNKKYQNILHFLFSLRCSFTQFSIHDFLIKSRKSNIWQNHETNSSQGLVKEF